MRAARSRSSPTTSGPSTPPTQPMSDESHTWLSTRATARSRSVGSPSCIALVMIAVIASLTRATASASFGCAEPSARTIAAVASGRCV